MKLNIYLFKILLLFIFSGSLFGQQVYNLGTQFEANSISNDGTIIAGTIGDNIYIWTSTGGLEQIGSITNGYPMAGRATISGDGTKVSATVTNPDTNLNEMSLYDVNSETWTYLGGIAGSSDGSKSSAWTISNDGNTVGGLGWVNAGTAHGILWTSTDGIIDMGSTVQDRSTRVNDLSDDGSIVVGWQDSSSGFRQGAIWIDGVQTLITDQNSDPVGEAGAISGDGNWVIGYNGFEAYRWNSEEGFHYISHPGSGMWFRGGATDINHDGSIIIGYYRPWPGSPYFGEGFIWTEETGRVELNEYVNSLGMDDLGITFSLPLGISADGSIITGMGLLNGSSIVGFMIKLPTAPQNDDCENAIALNCGDSIEGTTLLGSNLGGNDSNDVFYSYTGTGTQEEVTISLCSGITDFNTVLRVFTDCTLTEEIAFNDDECGEYSEVSFTSDGTSTYLIMVEGSSSEDEGSFTIEVECQPLSVQDNNRLEVNYYPNPVVETLTINSNETIQQIEIFNSTGQMISQKNISNENLNIDFSAYTNGIYFVKLISETSTNTIKIAKTN